MIDMRSKETFSPKVKKSNKFQDSKKFQRTLFIPPSKEEEFNEGSRGSLHSPSSQPSQMSVMKNLEPYVTLQTNPKARDENNPSY